MALTRGKRPCGRVHADACEGRHMPCGLAYRGPTGIVGPWLDFGVVTQMHYRARSFNLTFLRVFLRVGLCSHTVHTFCKQRERTAGVGIDLDGRDCVDPSPRHLNYNTCAKLDVSEVTYLSFGDAWTHKEHPIFIGRMTRDPSRMHDREDLHQRISSNDRDSMSH